MVQVTESITDKMFSHLQEHLGLRKHGLRFSNLILSLFLSLTNIPSNKCSEGTVKCINEQGWGKSLEIIFPCTNRTRILLVV